MPGRTAPARFGSASIDRPHRRSPAHVLAAVLVAFSTLLAGCASSSVPGLNSVLPAGLIPPVDDPVLVGAEEAARFLEPNEPIVGIDAVPGAEPRAYSLWMLDRREVVNDVVAGEPIVVTWCPLAGSTVVYDRRIEGRTLSFRASGKLYRDTLVVEDRETGTLWSQVDGRALVGPLRGRRLVARPSTRTSWASWRRLHPDSQVLAKGWWDRRGRSDYEGYAADPTAVGLFAADGEDDPRLEAKELVWGLVDGTEAVAIRLDGLDRATPLELDVDGRSLLVVAEPGGEAARAFRPAHDGRRLQFRTAGTGTLRDVETGSVWTTPELRAISGPLAGAALEPVVGRSIYWFAWSRFHPTSRIVPTPDCVQPAVVIAALGTAASHACRRPTTSQSPTPTTPTPTPSLIPATWTAVP